MMGKLFERMESRGSEVKMEQISILDGKIYLRRQMIDARIENKNLISM